MCVSPLSAVDALSRSFFSLFSVPCSLFLSVACRVTTVMRCDMRSSPLFWSPCVPPLFLQPTRVLSLFLSLSLSFLLSLFLSFLFRLLLSFFLLSFSLSYMSLFPVSLFLCFSLFLFLFRASNGCSLCLSLSSLHLPLCISLYLFSPPLNLSHFSRSSFFIQKE